MDYDEFLVARRRLMALVTHEGFKRLTDPNYVPDPPVRPQNRLRLSWPCHHSRSWLAVVVLPAGTLITAVDANDELIGEITEDGQLVVGDYAYNSPDRAAHEHGSDAGDGWSYWFAHLDDEPISLKELRERAAEQVGVRQG